MTKKELEMKVEQLEMKVKQLEKYINELPSYEYCSQASLKSLNEENYAYMFGCAMGHIEWLKDRINKERI